MVGTVILAGALSAANSDHSYRQQNQGAYDILVTLALRSRRSLAPGCRGVLKERFECANRHLATPTTDQRTQPMAKTNSGWRSVPAQSSTYFQG
jgi:hypothetical protein